MLHVQKDALVWDRDGGTAVTVLILAGTLAADLRLWVCMNDLGGFGQLH